MMEAKVRLAGGVSVEFARLLELALSNFLTNIQFSVIFWFFYIYM